MVSLYKDLTAIFIGSTVLYFIGSNIWSAFYPEQVYISTFVMIILIVLTMVFLSKIGKKRFAKEVMSHILICHVNEYLEKLEYRMGKKHGVVKSSYNYLKAMGYSALGDYDTVFECCKNITAKSHKTEYYRYMIKYCINNDQHSEARRNMEMLKSLASSEKADIYKRNIEIFLKNSEYRMRIKDGVFEGAEEFYTDLLNSDNTKTLISKVSYSYALGALLIKKGEPERAQEYLQFSAEKGGDTKYKKSAEQLLSELDL